MTSLKMKKLVALCCWCLFLSVIVRNERQHLWFCCCHGLSLSTFSRFHGTRLANFDPPSTTSSSPTTRTTTTTRALITMRKQKASDRRTRRMQRGGAEDIAKDIIRENVVRENNYLMTTTTTTTSPMTKAGPWNQRRSSVVQPPPPSPPDVVVPSSSSTTTSGGGGRGRSRKRSMLYNSLSSYHNKFLHLLTTEYRAEEEEVIGRIESSTEDPLGLELAGHALYDMVPQRRGNVYSDEIYRFMKAPDATQPTVPSSSRFTVNDVILVTLQPMGTGDFFDPKNLPTNTAAATTVEGRVTATGPTYIDIAIPSGIFEATFFNEAMSISHDPSSLRLRIDRFFSEIPYKRMVDALMKMSSIPERNDQTTKSSIGGEDTSSNKSNNRKAKNNKGNTISNSRDGKSRKEEPQSPHSAICMDELLREAIISTHAFTDPSTPLFHDVDACDLESLGRLLSKPPMPTSVKLANQVLSYVQANSRNGLFKPLNGPQLAAVGAALTRKLTLIQGPPGTGKTSTASVIGFGFTHQCRSISSNAKVLACAFSNVGADNLAEGFLQLGLKVVRIGKASTVSKTLGDYTLDAAIHRDPDARKAMDQASVATAELMKIRKNKKRKTTNGMVSERVAQEIATAAVKQSIKACNIAAVRAMREADIVVSTSTGAADPRLLAACGLNVDEDDLLDEGSRTAMSRRVKQGISATKAQNVATMERTNAPDGLSPLSFPFVIIDEACQSVEPGSLIPLTSSNSCRSLVLLGDPCQLPPTVKSDPDSLLSISLMERLAATLPAPMIKMKDERTQMDDTFVDSLPIKQSRSLLHATESQRGNNVSYRKRFAGSLLLSVQYRMHPSIAAFSSAIFYDGLLHTPSFLSNQRTFPVVLNEVMPCGDPSLGVRMINVGGKCNERKGQGNKYTRTVFSPNSLYSQEASSTYQNEAEAVRVLSLIKQILQFESRYNPVAGTSIGVVTPYSGQVQLIKSMIADDKDLNSLLDSVTATVEVNSVDGYQGRERDVIIFSAVRSNRRGDVGFLSDWRRLNVALTRSKSALLVVGDSETLSEGDKHWAAFLKWCQGVRCIQDDTESGDCDSL